MAKRSKSKASAGAAASESHDAAAAAGAHVESPRAAAPASASRRATTTRPAAAAAANMSGLKHPLPPGVTDQAFTKEYIPPENTMARLARRLRWSWHIHAVSCMLDPWESVLLNVSALAVSAAVGYYLVSNTAGLLDQTA